MTTTDGDLNATSRELLGRINEVKELEKRKRGTARSTPEFHSLAEDVEVASREVYRVAERANDEDAAATAERAEQHPRDAT